MAETSEIIVDRFDKQPLKFNDADLEMLTQFYKNDVIELVPGFQYWGMNERRKMNRPDNICGYQQRAFEFYWAVRGCVQMCKMGLSLGSGGIGSPGVFTTDKFNGEIPNQEMYNNNQNSMMEINADVVPYPFLDGVFGIVVLNHSLEHFNNQLDVLRECLRIMVHDGYICMIQPDMSFMGRNCTDPTHTREYCADEFYNLLEELRKMDKAIPFEIVEHNTFDNAFSFNTVLQRK